MKMLFGFIVFVGFGAAIGAFNKWDVWEWQYWATAMPMALIWGFTCAAAFD